jgi:hypothetical protein
MLAFLMNEDKYEIQHNGTCARMGPLSGDGTPKLFAVHDGKVYNFASEQCRATFQDDPLRFIDTNDPAPQPTDEQRAHGRRLFGKAVDAFACTAGIDNLISLRQVAAREVKSGEKTYSVTNNVVFKYPDGVFDEVCWDDSCWAHIVDGAEGWAASKKGREQLNAQQRAFLNRTTGRHPIAILRHRDDKNIIISGAGEKRTIAVPEEGDVEVELVAVHRDGVTTTLGVDASGRVRLMAFRGWAGASGIGDVECIYSRFESVDGVRLPMRMDVTFNGKPVESEGRVYTEQVINDPKDLERFVPRVAAATSSSEGASN